MNSSVTPSLLSPSSPDQTNSLLGSETLDIQDQNSSQLDHHHRIHSPRIPQDETAIYDNDSKSSVTKTEYKSNFTPFDQYVYNEITDSFVKQSNHRNTVSGNLLAELKRPLSSSGSNQDLAAHSESHASNAVSPALEAGSFEPVGNSDAGSNLNPTNEPWYKEVAKRNKKANEYRLKSELGHSSALMAEPDVIRKSPLGNDPMIEAQIHEKQQQLQSGYKFNQHEYKRDHLIAHMANNNNFKLPKEDGVNSSTGRRVVISSSGTARPLSRTTAASRARSQSSKRPNSSLPSKPETLTKSNQTTPTRTVPSRAPPATALRSQSKSTTPSSRQVGTTTNGVNRPTTAAPARSTTTAPSRVTTSKPLTTLKSPRTTSAASSSKTTESKTRDLTVSRMSARTSVPSVASKSPVKRTLNSTSTSNRASPSAKPISSRNSRLTTKQPTKLVTSTPSNATVKSIKTKALVNAGQQASTDATTGSKDIETDTKLLGLRPGSDFISASETVSAQDVASTQGSDVNPEGNEEFNGRETSLIFSPTKAGTMLADEIAQAEKAAHETVLMETPQGDDKITVSSGDLEDRSNLELSKETLSPEFVPKQLINGLEEGLVSAEDRYESSERDASLECKSQSNDQLSEQHDQSYEHEPYSIMPTTYPTENKAESAFNDESNLDRDRNDPDNIPFNSSPSQEGVSPCKDRSNLSTEQLDLAKDEAHQSAQNLELKPGIHASVEQIAGTAVSRAQNDDSTPNPLAHSDSEDDELSHHITDAGKNILGSQNFSVEDIKEITQEDVHGKHSPSHDEDIDEKNASNESSPNDHEFSAALVERRNSESHTSDDYLASALRQKAEETTVTGDVMSDTSRIELRAEPDEMLKPDDPPSQSITPNEIALDSDRSDQMIKHGDSHEDLVESSIPPNQPIDARDNIQTDHDNNETLSHSTYDIDKDDEIFVDKNELLMNVSSLESLEITKRQAMSQRSELARKQSGSSTLLAGQPPSELVLSVDQLDEFYAHVSPNQAEEFDQAQQVEEKNNDLDRSHDLTRDDQDVDQGNDFNEPIPNIQDTLGTEETLVQPEVKASIESTADLLNFGSITPTNDDQSASNSGVAESHPKADTSSDNEPEVKTFDTFEINRQSSIGDSHHSVRSKDSLSESGDDIAVDQPKNSDSVTNLETDSNQATKSTASAIEDEMDEDEQLKLSNHLTNSDDDVILEPRNRKGSLSGAFSPLRSTSPSRYNEGAGLGIMVRDDEELGTVESSDGSSAQIDAPTVAENRAEISTSKSLIPDIPQTSMLLHTQKLSVFDDDDEGYDLNPLADPIDVAATMSPSSSVAEEMLRLSRQASLANAISDMIESQPTDKEAAQEKLDGNQREDDLIGVRNLQKSLDQSIEHPHSSSTSASSSPAQNPDSKVENTTSADVDNGERYENNRTVDLSNNNEANNVDTRKQSIDINSDRNNTVEQSGVDKQPSKQPLEM